jgi:hypothetical protein
MWQKEVNKILKQIDPDKTKNLITSLDKLLTYAANDSAIKNISKALEAAASLSDLLQTANEFISPAKCFLYGATGAILGAVLIKVIQAYLQNKNDKRLQESMDKLVAINMQQLMVEIQLLRISAADYVLKADLAEYNNPSFIMRQELKDIRDDNMLMVRILTPMDIKELELLQKSPRNF